ncbi:MAG: imidazolonepropionase [Rectinemataceae bacterium]
MSESEGNILIVGIGELCTPLGASARKGGAMRDVSRVADAAIVARDGIIAYAGPRSGLDPDMVEGLSPIDARGMAVIPGFVDSHTHFIFAGYRSDEFLMRTGGASYMEIHRSGGGIIRSVEATRAAELEELARLGEARAWAMVQQGVTTVEAKSGYGLDRDTELRQLEAAHLVAERLPIDVVPTYMGLHSPGPEFENSSRYVDYAIAEVLPAVAAQGFARYADAFCEDGIFGVEDCRRFLTAAKGFGLGMKLHAEEIEWTGASALAAELGAASADHLLRATDDDFRLLAGAGVVATCLPLTSFCLGAGHAKARAMIDAGCALALATDLNPGSAASGSIPLAIAIAVIHMGLSVEETLTAFTLNGAAALGLAHETGSIEPGKRADFVLLEAPSISYLPYRSGVNLVAATFKDGELAYRA